ncbi:hypothetical protein SRHO_G00030630 [Serrasalmus rhombeus]
MESFSLPFSSAQAAELYTITRACILSQDRDVTIYTDSRYAFGVVHDFGGIWSQRGFVTSDNKPISHASLMEDLIRASFLPSCLAVVKVRAHQRGSVPDSIGNNAADSAAGRGALHGPPCPFLDSSSFSCAALTVDCLPGLDLVDIQSSASPSDTQHWLSCGYDPAVVPFRDGEGRLCLPAHCVPFLVPDFHGISHRERRGVKHDMSELFCIHNLNSAIDRILDRCLVCAQNNPKPKGPHQVLPKPETPFQEWQIDFTHMTTVGPHKYLLVMIDTFSRWTEAFPCNKENANTVVTKLCQEIIPRYGVPLGIDSDKGTPFTSKVTQALAKQLSIDWAFHIPYHPQSSGMVERVNRTIKGRLRKAMQTQNTTNWVKVLPVVLAELRMTRTDTLGGLSPYEIVMGRPFPVPWRQVTALGGLADLEKHDAADNALSLLGRCLMDQVYALASSLVPHRSDYVFMAQTVQQPIYASLEPSYDVAVSASV